MADLSDVMNQLASIATTAVYPNGTSNPSITTRPITIGQGWPKPADLDTCFASNPPKSMVTVFCVSGATANSAQLFEPPYLITAPVHGMSLATSVNAITITGNPNVGEYLTLIVNGAKVYSQVAVLGDTASTMASKVATLAAVDYPGTSAIGNVINVASPAAHQVVARVGAPGTMGQLLHRQKQHFRITAWAPSPADRSTIAAALDVAYKQNIKLTFSDTSQGILTYQSTYLDDNSQNIGEYRRDLCYACEYGTIDTFPVYEITSVTLVLKNLDTNTTYLMQVT